MKLLLCLSNLNDVEPFLRRYSASVQVSSALKFISQRKMFHHEVDVLETGVGVYQTTYKVTKALAANKYHLALKVSLANAYKEELEPGTALNVINEKPGDFGMMNGGEWKDHYDFGQLNREDEPHVRGGFINLTNSYMDIFLPFKKVVGITVNHYGDKSTVAMRREKYKVDCETGDGLGFVYPCLYEKQPFYQLCVVERNLASGKEDLNAAKEAMNKILIDVIQKL